MNSSLVIADARKEQRTEELNSEELQQKTHDEHLSFHIIVQYTNIIT